MFLLLNRIVPYGRHRHRHCTSSAAAILSSISNNSNNSNNAARASSSSSLTLTPSNIKLAEGLLAGDRSCLAKSITLIESSRLDHQEQADLLLGYLAETDSKRRRRGGEKTGANKRFQHGKTLRLGFAGPPGGKAVCMYICRTVHVIYVHIYAYV